MYINLQQSRVCRSIITVQVFGKKIASFINSQLPIELIFKSTLSDMRHRETYMYVNFQQNRVNSSVLTVQLAIRILKNYAFRTRTTP